MWAGHQACSPSACLHCLLHSLPPTCLLHGPSPIPWPLPCSLPHPSPSQVCLSLAGGGQGVLQHPFLPPHLLPCPFPRPTFLSAASVLPQALQGDGLDRCLGSEATLLERWETESELVELERNSDLPPSPISPVE